MKKNLLNNFIRFLLNNDGESFKNGISAYTDVDRAIDVLIFTYFIYAGDNTSKNIIWASYDGVKWIPSVYDLDGTWGLKWDGSVSYPVTGFTPNGRNLLNERLFANYKEEITARYLELREDILSVANINKMFDAFFAKIPQIVYEAEAKRWPSSPSHEENTPTQIKEYAKARAEYNDGWYGVTVQEKQNSGYKVSFTAPAGTKIYVYPSKDYTQTPVRAVSAFSVNDSGELTKTDGQVNFSIVPPEGYEVSSVTASPEKYKNIKGPADTEQENTYRITKITGDISVNIGVSKLQSEPVGYNVTFETEHAKVYVYSGQDYSETPVQSETAVSLDSDTGLPTKSGDGQINFLVVPDEGYGLASVTVMPKNYKNIKAPDETGKEGVYRITKITGELTVSVRAEPTTEEPTTEEPTTEEPTTDEPTTEEPITDEPTTDEPAIPGGTELLQKITSWFREIFNKIKELFDIILSLIK